MRTKLTPWLFIALTSLGLMGCGEFGKRRVFITRQVFPGNLINGGGLAGGDAACNDAARAAGRSGQFKAWLSAGTEDAIDRMAAGDPWYDFSDMLIFRNHDRLMTDPENGIWLDEHGQYLDPDTVYWTGTRGGGRGRVFVDIYQCKGWTSTSSNESGYLGRVGSTAEQHWTEGASTSCERPMHLLCFEQ